MYVGAHIQYKETTFVLSRLSVTLGFLNAGVQTDQNQKHKSQPTTFFNAGF